MDESIAGGPEKRRLGEPKHHHWVEIISAVLMALATVASAWSAYQASRWHSKETGLYAKANEDRIHASEAADLADQQVGIDAGLFSDYCYAYFEGDIALFEFYENNLFRAEMRTAVEAWKATKPLSDPAAPKSPFEMEEYRNENRERSRKLELAAREETDEAKKAVEHSDRYVLMTVLFASVLFFAGIATKFDSFPVKTFLLGFGWLLFIGTVAYLVLQPIT